MKKTEELITILENFLFPENHLNPDFVKEALKLVEIKQKQKDIKREEIPDEESFLD